jgi:glyoxylase-like metal-dependent hydrolase (beta-lactamase superfamily II)
MPTHALHQLTARVWWLDPFGETDRPALGVVAGERGSLIIDAGNSPAHVRALREQLERHGLPAPQLAALTHWHWDHIFGADELGVPALASHETQRVARALAGLGWDDESLDQRVEAGTEIAFCRDMIKAELPDRTALRIRPPEIGFTGEIAVDPGGVPCRLIHVGGDHSPDGIVVHVPGERVAFIGDAIYDDLYHGPRRLTAAGIFPLLEGLLALEADFYVAGHHGEPMTREQLLADAAELRAIGATVGRIGDDRDAVLAALPESLGAAPSADQVEIADAFLAGLRLPVVEPPL